MMFLLLLAAQAAPAPLPSPAHPIPWNSGSTGASILPKNDPRAAEMEAGQWQRDGGGFLSHQCLGIAYAS